MELVFLLRDMKGSVMKSVLKFVRFAGTELARVGAMMLVAEVLAMHSLVNLDGKRAGIFVGLLTLLIPASAIVNFVNKKIGEFLKD